MTLIETIAPCPFCGHGDPYWDEIEIDDAPAHFLACPECCAEGPVGTSHEAAAARWNERAH